jgi:EGF-like domain
MCHLFISVFLTGVGVCVRVFTATAACGNQRCEFGEECKDPSCSSGCAADCPRYVPGCPMGLDTRGRNATCSAHGVCRVGSNVCSCHAGYTGEKCDVCTADRVRLRANGACVFVPGSTASCSDGVKNGNEEGVDCGGPNCGECPSTSPIPYFLIGGCVTISVFVLIALYLVRRYFRMKERIKPLPKKGAGAPLRSTRNAAVKVIGSASPAQQATRHSSTVAPSALVVAALQPSQQHNRDSPAFKFAVPSQSTQRQAGGKLKSESLREPTVTSSAQIFEVPSFIVKPTAMSTPKQSLKNPASKVAPLRIKVDSPRDATLSPAHAVIEWSEPKSSRKGAKFNFV